MRVAQLSGQRVPGEGVDGEVAAAQVFLDGVGKGDPRPAAERLDVAAEGGHLVQLSIPPQHSHGSVLHPYGHRATKELLHLRWAGSGRKIPVARREPGQNVSHGTADGPCGKARLLQTTGDPLHLGRCIEQRRRHPAGAWGGRVEVGGMIAAELDGVAQPLGVVRPHTEAEHQFDAGLLDR